MGGSRDFRRKRMKEYGEPYISPKAKLNRAINKVRKFIMTQDNVPGMEADFYRETADKVAEFMRSGDWIPVNYGYDGANIESMSHLEDALEAIPGIGKVEKEKIDGKWQKRFVQENQTPTVAETKIPVKPRPLTKEEISIRAKTLSEMMGVSKAYATKIVKREERIKQSYIGNKTEAEIDAEFNEQIRKYGLPF